MNDGSLVFKARIGVTFVIGFTQLVMAFLAIIDRLNPNGVISSIWLFNTLIDDNYWGGMFMISSIICLLGLRYINLNSVSMSIASGLLLVWGTLTIGDVLTVGGNGIPLVGGVLSLATGVVAYFMSQVWNTIIWENKIKTLSPVPEGPLRVKE